MAETKTKASYKDEAKVALDSDTRSNAQVDALAAQLEQQDKGRTPADAQEITARAAHTAEGGGAWPEDLLRERYLEPVGALSTYSPEQNYTSHEDAKS